MASFFKNFGVIFDKPKVKKILLPENVELEMIWVDPGTFTMGSQEDELGSYIDETVHRVTISKGFWLGKYPVTQAQYQAVMGNNPVRGYGEGDKYPVYNVSWHDAKEKFCKELTDKEKDAERLPRGYEYTLPTEAQWEYACRARTTTALNSGKNLTTKRDKCPNMDEVGWYKYNSGQQTHPVGQKKPNYWGFYDMHGNVWEWCLDWYGNYPPPGSVTDPKGPEEGFYKVMRGGSWHHDAHYCRSADRYYYYPDHHYGDYGFRVALSPTQ